MYKMIFEKMILFLRGLGMGGGRKIEEEIVQNFLHSFLYVSVKWKLGVYFTFPFKSDVFYDDWTFLNDL